MKRFSILVLGVCLVAPRALAADLEIPIHFAKQEQNNWCWAASAQAILSADGRTFEQCVLASIALGLRHRYCCDEVNIKYCDKGFHPELALEAYGLRTRTVGSLAPSEIEHELKNRRPFIVVVDQEITRHAMVAYGLTAQGRMKIWNPDSGGEKLEYTADELNREKGRWVATHLAAQPLRGSRTATDGPADLRKLREELDSLLRESPSSPRSSPSSPSDVRRELDELKRWLQQRR